ncbi:hypothetical protein BGZ51_001227, partial [Haplosporangium sp. Z 767]
MGVPGLWPFLRKKGYEAEKAPYFPQIPLPPNNYYRVDVLASFYNIIRWIYINHDSTTSPVIFERHLRLARLPQGSSILYLDGPSPEEKRMTREFREARRSCALDKARASINCLEETVRDGRR